jgi:endogenous inhibitor of DNA gyrase (YacG/DUF329 family)
MTKLKTRGGAPSPCPICGTPARPNSAPFCSVRCADVDLGRWFGERYRVPTEAAVERELLPEEDAG